MRRLALVTCAALVLIVPPHVRAGESCVDRAAAAAADPAAESTTDTATGCKEDGACCGDAACAGTQGDQASAGTKANCPCGRAKEKQL